MSARVVPRAVTVFGLAREFSKLVRERPDADPHALMLEAYALRAGVRVTDHTTIPADAVKTMTRAWEVARVNNWIGGET